MFKNNFIRDYYRLTERWIKEYAEERKGKNVVFSPFSLISLLSIAADATEGRTREEIETYLCENISFREFREELKKIKDSFATSKELSAANAVIVKESLKDTIQPLYEQTVKERFDGTLFLSGQAAEDVNAWVKEKTKGMISEIADRSVEEMLVAMLSAIAFDAQWADKYEDKDIQPDDFINYDNSISRVLIMRSTESTYIENRNFSGFVKPYKDTPFSFMALLPKSKELKIRRNLLRSIDFTELFSAAISAEVHVSMPEFSCTFSDDLAGRLQRSDINELFTPQADFRPLSTFPLMAGSLKHRALIKVNRHGTKAAAVSCFVIAAGSAGINDPKFVTLDRPFVYAIIHNPSGLPVFTGFINYLDNASSEDLDDISGRKLRREKLYKECTILYESIGDKLSPDWNFEKGTTEYDLYYKARDAYMYGNLQELQAIEQKVDNYLLFKDQDSKEHFK